MVFKNTNSKFRCFQYSGAWYSSGDCTHLFSFTNLSKTGKNVFGVENIWVSTLGLYALTNQSESIYSHDSITKHLITRNKQLTDYFWSGFQMWIDHSNSGHYLSTIQMTFDYQTIQLIDCLHNQNESFLKLRS